MSTTVAEKVLAKADANNARWRDRDEHYWFARLTQEVGELGSSLVGDHRDPPEWELIQIASIAVNWLRMREESGVTQARQEKDAREAENRAFNNFFDEEYS